MTEPALPILDWRRFAEGTDVEGFVADLGAACRGPGFFLLRGHGIDDDLVREVFAQADALFHLPPEQKAAVAINTSNRGWAAQGTERLDEKSDDVDQKEAFNIGLDLAPDDPRIVAKESFRAINQWPDLPVFRDVMLRYFAAALDLGTGLHRALARDLGLEPHYFDTKLDAPMAFLRLLHYPPATGAAHEIGAGAHTDYGSITLLITDGEAGLQVRPQGGDWIDVPHVPDAFVVNIGDALMRWSNDTYTSTLHRVKAPQHQRRSVAFFLDPNPDAMIEALPGTGAPRYPAVAASDYLASRLAATYGDRR